MAHPTYLDATGATRSRKAQGSAGDNADPDVTSVVVDTLPALVAGSAKIGDVGVLTVPADPFGANADAASATGSIAAKLRFIAGTGIPITGTVTVGSHAVTNSGTFAVQIDGAALTALQLIDDPVFADDAAFSPGSSKVMMAGFQADETATDSVDEGDAGAARMTLDRKQIVADYAHTTGGEESYTVLQTSGAVIAAEIKGSPGQVYSMEFSNDDTVAVYVRLYDMTGTPASTDGANIKKRFMISPNNGGVAKTWAKGVKFATGIGIRVTKAIADNDTTVLTANKVQGNVGYK